MGTSRSTSCKWSQGGLGITGMMKHHYSTLLKEDPDHYGHDSTKPPHPNITKKWASVVILMTCLLSSVKEKEERKVVDLESAGLRETPWRRKITNAFRQKYTVYMHLQKRN